VGASVTVSIYPSRVAQIFLLFVEPTSLALPRTMRMTVRMTDWVNVDLKCPRRSCKWSWVASRIEVVDIFVLYEWWLAYRECGV